MRADRPDARGRVIGRAWRTLPRARSRRDDDEAKKRENPSLWTRESKNPQSVETPARRATAARSADLRRSRSRAGAGERAGGTGRGRTTLAP